MAPPTTLRATQTSGPTDHPSGHSDEWPHRPPFGPLRRLAPPTTHHVFPPTINSSNRLQNNQPLFPYLCNFSLNPQEHFHLNCIKINIRIITSNLISTFLDTCSVHQDDDNDYANSHRHSICDRVLQNQAFGFYIETWFGRTQSLGIHASAYIFTAHTPHAARLRTTISPTSTWCGPETSVVFLTTDANRRDNFIIIVHFINQVYKKNVLTHMIISNYSSLLTSLATNFHVSLFSIESLPLFLLHPHSQPYFTDHLFFFLSLFQLSLLCSTPSLLKISNPIPQSFKCACSKLPVLR